ncbi:lysosomal-associated transmembrane protein 4A [Trichinella spiralis]|uniref:lysosomal-associated transmembrane protein 4A n=1 Tax=Trichinella spiralis TaxID=6334 RepID=UPI0001EFE4B2|nr:lysosomal-associated transmembrane protein 4A [Trichinella spiralis]
MLFYWSGNQLCNDDDKNNNNVCNCSQRRSIVEYRSRLFFESSQLFTLHCEHNFINFYTRRARRVLQKAASLRVATARIMFRTGRYGRHLANDPRFRCCGCCHVQTGAVCLGLYNITLQCFALCFLIFTVVNPDVFFELNVKQGLLQSGYNESYELDDFNKIGIHERLPELPTPVPQNSFSLADNDHHAGFVPSRAEVLVITRRRLRPADAHLAIALVFGLMFITSMMIYGIFKGRPLYLIPFFCFQVFDLILSCLTAVGHYTWMPSVEDIIQQNPDLPFRDQLAGLNSQWIAICILLFYLLIIVVKIYFIGIVWSCYQFLQAANADNMRLDDPKADMDNVQIFTPTEIVETTVKLPPAYDELPPQYTAAYFPYAR